MSAMLVFLLASIFALQHRTPSESVALNSLFGQTLAGQEDVIS